MSQELKVAVLSKRGRNRSGLNFSSNWQDRRITLFSTNLVYGPPDGPPKDSVPINSTTVIGNIEVDKKPFAFKITTGGEELILNCESEAERDSWVTAISNIANPPPVDNSLSAEQVALNAEMERMRIAKEKAAADEEARLLKQQHETEAMRKEREAAEAAKKKAHEEAEARRVAEEKKHKEALAAAEAAAESARAAAAALEKERQAKAALLSKISVAVSCNKKLSTESAFKPRFIWIKEDTKEFHWGKTADDYSNGKSKCIVIAQHMKSVKVNNENTTPNFSIELVDAAELPESVYTKTVFSGAAPTSIDITMDDAVLNTGFVNYLREVKK